MLFAFFFPVLAALHPVYAEGSIDENTAIVGSLSRVADFAELLQGEGEEALEDTLDGTSGRQQAYVVVVTVDPLGGGAAGECADGFYDDYPDNPAMPIF